jgi:hypothetical protein
MERKDDTVLKALKAKVRRMNKQNGGLGMINLGHGKEKV